MMMTGANWLTGRRLLQSTELLACRSGACVTSVLVTVRVPHYEISDS